MKKDLEDIAHSYLDRVDRLVKLGSIQSNESFNNTVTSKAPKNRYVIMSNCCAVLSINYVDYGIKSRKFNVKYEFCTLLLQGGVYLSWLAYKKNFPL